MVDELSYAPYHKFETLGVNAHIEGVCGEILRAVTSSLRMNYTLFSPPGASWGLRKPDGNWTGLIGMLQQDEIDVGLSVINPTSEKADVAVATHTTIAIEILILAGRMKRENSSIYDTVQIFSWQVWCCFIGCILACSIMSTCSSVVASSDGSTSNRRNNWLSIFWRHLWDFIGNSLLESSPTMPRGTAARIVVSVFWIVVVVLSTAFAGQMKAMMMVKKETDRIDTIKDLSERPNVRPYVPKGSAVESLLQMRRWQRSLVKKVRVHSSLAPAVNEELKHGSPEVCRPVEGAKAFEEIPGPKPLPIIGNIWRYLPGIGEYDLTHMHRNAQLLFKRYGPLVREVIVGDRVVVHVFDPRDMEQVFRHEGRYPSRLSHRALLKYRLERPQQYSSGGMFPSNGEEWLRLRHMFQKPLMQHKAMNVYMRPLQEITCEVAHLIRKARNGTSMEMEDFLKELYSWALECTGVLVLNSRLGCLRQNLKHGSEAQRLVEAAAETHRIVMVTENGLPLWKLFNTPTYKKLVETQDFMASVVLKYLKKAQQEVGPEDSEETRTILEKFLCNPEIDFRDVFTMAVDMFLAGIDTTAYSTAFMLYHLSTNPRCQERLCEELTGLMPSPESHLDLNQLANAPYLRACIKESLRMNPIAIGIGRILPEDVVLSGFNVPAGTLLITHNQAACRHEVNYEDPDAFRPERWIKEQNSAARAHPFCSLPFGYGPRMCVGRRFAETVMSLLLARLIRTFEVSYRHEEIDCFTRLINVPDKPLKLAFRDRL
ncbi:cytochrome P450 302a1, mitochondrial-like [Ornithodoros turicata]|uniref:cytochrome P450 302a1, mitochondrial-like n=1 Tax=Ornithodoros turicata TaxID=34597 RepID=UPI003139D276